MRRPLGLPIADILLEAMLQFPHDARRRRPRQINARCRPAVRLVQKRPESADARRPEGSIVLSHQVRSQRIAGACI